MSFEKYLRPVSAAVAAITLIAFSFSAHIVARTPPLAILTALGLTAEEIAAVDAGRPVARVLPWGGPSEVYVFGAVHVDARPETYLRAARDVQRLSGAPGYLGTVNDFRA